MNEQLKKISFYVGGAFLFNVLFYNEQMALNTLFFDGYILLALYYLYPSAKTNTIVRWLLIIHVFSLVTLLIHNTVVSKFAFIITLLLLTGFSEYVHRSAWYAGGSVILNFVLFIGNFAETVISFVKRKKNGSPKWTKYIRLSLIPLILVFIFFVIYANANSVLSNISYKVADWIEVNLQKFFSVFIWERIAFTLLGLYITGSLLTKTRINYFSINDLEQTDVLIRKRKIFYKQPKRTYQTVKRFSNIGLKNENTIGIISLVLLNALLFIVNCIDIDFVWLHFEFRADKPIYKLVHEGTELLIISLILAMSVVLFFFKGNLNFYKRNKWLKYGTYAWILQNGFLVLSVLLRDYYYILHYGLAYKRIGVLFFLLMVLVGLITVFVKVFSRKTGYFLFRVNAWSTIILLTIASFVNWDVSIAKYNLAHKGQITLDSTFLLTLSDKTLPVLYEHADVFMAKDPSFSEFINKRIQNYMDNRKEYSWLSWNYSDNSVQKYFKQNYLKSQ